MEIQIRLAQRCDMQSILEMSKDLYGGHDYFPHVFLRWLDDSKRRILVAEKGGVIIGLRAFHVIDDGKTVVNYSLRVHRDYRRQGISALIIQAEKEYVQAHFPSVQNERCMVTSTNIPRLAIARKALDSLLLELGLVAFYVDPVSAGTRCQNGPSCSFFKQTRVDDAPVVSPLGFDEFRDLVEGKKLDGVVWRNTMIVDWQPFEAHPSNFKNGLIMDGDFFLASSANMGSGAVGSLSHGRFSPKVKCRHWVATIYSCDEKLVKMHVTKQLECAILKQGTSKGAFIFTCFLPKSLTSCAKDYLSEEFSLEYVDYYNFNLLLFEKDFTS